MLLPADASFWEIIVTDHISVRRFQHKDVGARLSASECTGAPIELKLGGMISVYSKYSRNCLLSWIFALSSGYPDVMGLLVVCSAETVVLQCITGEMTNLRGDFRASKMKQYYVETENRVRGGNIVVADR